VRADPNPLAGDRVKSVPKERVVVGVAHLSRQDRCIACADEVHQGQPFEVSAAVGAETHDAGARLDHLDRVRDEGRIVFLDELRSKAVHEVIGPGRVGSR
jgi:hypothetical protein